MYLCVWCRSLAKYNTQLVCIHITMRLHHSNAMQTTLGQRRLYRALLFTKIIYLEISSVSSSSFIHFDAGTACAFHTRFGLEPAGSPGCASRRDNKVFRMVTQKSICAEFYMAHNARHIHSTDAYIGFSFVSRQMTEKEIAKEKK